MAIATPHLRSRNTGKKMHQTINPLSLWSFSLVLYLWCATLACAIPSSQIEQCELVCENNMVDGLSITGNCETKCPPGVTPPTHVDPFNKPLDDKLEPRGKKREGDSETHPDNTDNKRRRLQGRFRDASTEREWKYGGETEASGDLSVNVGLEIMENGAEYVMKIRRMTQSEDGDDVERVKQMTQNAAMLLLHGEMLQDMGQKLLAQSRASLRSKLRKSIHES